MVSTKTVVTLLVVIFILFFVVQSPQDAANVVHSVGHFISHVFDRVSQFLKSLSS